MGDFKKKTKKEEVHKIFNVENITDIKEEET